MKLNNQIIELIAVGASITANCQSCLQYHVKKALDSGADEQEITEAIGIGKMVRQGAASKMDKLASELNAAAPSPVAAVDAGCGCGLL